MPNVDDDANQGIDGVEKRDVGDSAVQHPDDQEQPDEGPAMSGAGAQPSGSSMNHWDTSQPQADATKPETMPHTASEPLPGETADREAV